MTDTPQDDGPPDIWLEPKCDPERCWLDADPGDCDDEDCGAKSVQYIRADRIAALRAENEALRAGLHEARLQLEYLDGRFATGTTPAVVAGITALLGSKP